ncbi:hypothetical protein ACFQ3W_00765 [Paenibacillus puldeungensis]|uniref:Uncharacterized protein n=1 Tax=Paenibacillus puldeungensis TaxID=696536 RepID=A0ABW3RRU0_9BACL
MDVKKMQDFNRTSRGTSVGGTFLNVLAGCFYLCVFLALVGGIAITAGSLLGFDMSFAAFKIGNWEVPDLWAFPISIPIALLFYFCGKKLRKAIK